jgi:hypothetical protein
MLIETAFLSASSGRPVKTRIIITQNNHSNSAHSGFNTSRLNLFSTILLIAFTGEYDVAKVYKFIEVTP